MRLYYVLFASLLALSGCAKQSSSPVNTSVKTASHSFEMSYANCSYLIANQTENYAIYAKSDNQAYVLIGQVLFRHDLLAGDISRVMDETLTLDGICVIESVQGFVRSIKNIGVPPPACNPWKTHCPKFNLKTGEDT